MADSAIDNDVILKCVSYGFFSELIAAFPNGPHVFGMLGTARFVVGKLLQKRPPKRAEAAADFEHALQTLEVLEPTSAETATAAELELAAQQQALRLQGGECQLIAIVVHRNFRFLLTGDRAAIESCGRLVPPPGFDIAALRGKLACLEQAIWHLVQAQGAQRVRAAVCAEREVDTGLRICFSCSSDEVGEASWLEGIESHIRALRQEAGGLLMP